MGVAFVYILFLLISMTTCKGNLLSYTHLADHNKDECVCFQNPHGLQTVSHILGSGVKKYERLIIYFYWEVNSHQKLMYIPNEIKQKVMPDLVFEDSDYLSTATCEKMFEILNNKHIPIIPNDNDNHNVILDNGLNSPNHTEYTTSSLSLSPDIPPFEPDASPDMFSGEIPDIISGVIPDIISGVIPNVIAGVIPDIISGVDAIPNKEKYIYDDNYSTPSNMQIDSDDGIHDYPNLIDELIENDLQLDNPHHKIPVYSGNTILKHDALIIDSDEPEYDKWLLNQLSRCDQEIIGKLNKIKLNSLKLSIKKVLTQNELTLTKSGLVDKNGTKLDINNYEVKPILIGNLNNTKKLLQQYFTGKNDSLDNKNYFEIVVIASKHPHKILGYFPLSATNVTESALTQLTDKVATGHFQFGSELGWNGQENLHHEDTLAKVDPDLTGEGSSKIHRRIPFYLLNHPLNQKKNHLLQTGREWPGGYGKVSGGSRKFKNGGSGELGGSFGKILSSGPGKIKFDGHAKLETGSPEWIDITDLENIPFEEPVDVESVGAGKKELGNIDVGNSLSDNSEHWNRNLNQNFQSKLKFYNTLRGLRDFLNMFNTYKRLHKPKEQYYTPENKNVLSHKHYEGPVDSNPVFRIIGGSAATSSGAPVSNKARSAFSDGK